jgi:hypothetical protein
MVRDAKPEEFPTTAKWCGLLESDGQVEGHVCASMINGLPFVHDLEHWGNDSFGVARLLIAARKQVRAWGWQKVYVNINPPYIDMLNPLLEHGFKVVMFLLEGEI